MNTQLLILFIILSIVNVILNTIKSIITVNGGKFGAALINAITFFVYTYVIIYTNCELNMHLKAFITAVINIIGVYSVKLIEEKARKDKLWKVEATVVSSHTDNLHKALKDVGLSHNFIKGVGVYDVFNIYCETQADSTKAKSILNTYKAKYFVSESKTL